MLSTATLLGPAEAARVGITMLPPVEAISVLVEDPTKPIGNVRIGCRGGGGVFYFQNGRSTGQLTATLRADGNDTVAVFLDAGAHYASIPIISFRSNRQFVFWGAQASAVGCSIELEGEGKGLILGDDALISSGIWFRNHDMHALVDLTTGAILNPQPGTIVIERHVWIGQDVLVLGDARVQYGSILGAKSLVKGMIPPTSVVGGTPARLLRENTSWGRNTTGLTVEERHLLDALNAMPVES